MLGVPYRQDITGQRYGTEHADIQVILDATREQLEGAPAFVWLDQQNTTEKKSETNPAVIWGLLGTGEARKNSVGLLFKIR
jgi:hypothetical protein